MMRFALVGPAPFALAERLQGATVQTHRSGAELELGGCDAVAVLEPRQDDDGVIGRCLAAGKHVLLTPPTHLLAAALDRLSAQARRSGVQLAVLNPDRFLPSRRLISQQLDAGRLGEPGLVRVHHWRPGPGHPFAAVQRDLDVAIWLIGRPPSVIYATEAAGRSCQLHLGFPDGPMALVDYACCLPDGEGYRSLSLIGSSGAAYADDHQNVQLLLQGGRPRAIRVPEEGREILAVLQAFVCSVDRGDDLAPSAAAWRLAAAVVEACRRSAATGRAVPLEGW